MRPTTTATFLLLITAATALSSMTHAATASLPRHPGVGANASASCSPRERDALLAFKRGITDDRAGLLASWSWRQHDDDDGGQQDCCRWRGVRCNGRTGHVVGLHLRNTHAELDDLLEYPKIAMFGEISPSLLSLHHLEHLDVSLNVLQGPSRRVPKFLGSLKNLRYLNLSGIPFSGEVPPQLGNLTNLHYLDLSSVSTDLSCTDLSWLARLRSLTYIDMSDIDLGMVQDWAHVVNNVPSLKVLRLSCCRLTFANQSLSHFNLTNLEELDLSLNFFQNPVASGWFWNAKRLKYLDLSNTNLYGQSPMFQLPNALGHLKSLQVLDLSYINNMYIMTANMTNLCNLRILRLESSNVYGDIAELIDRLPQCLYNRLSELHLSGSRINGIIPNRLDHLTSLVILDMSWNELSGHVPSDIGMFSKLTYLDLSGNRLDGVITNEHLASLRSLKVLNLSGNSLNISVDSDWLPPFSLGTAMLGSCYMGPLFPSWLKSQVNITYLDISFAGITDRLPSWFSTTFSSTQVLDVSNNGISGSLPANMEVMTTLSILKLDSNKLTGQIPLLPKGLKELDLSQNSLSGPLPSEIGMFSNLTYLNLGSNKLHGVITSEHFASLRSLDALYLSGNTLNISVDSDWLPPFSLGAAMLGSCYMGPLFPSWLKWQVSIVDLNISFAGITDRLPSWFSTTFSKAHLIDVSNNGIYGNLPANMTVMTTLAELYLNSNKLTGQIPLLPKSLEIVDISRNSLSGPLPLNFRDRGALSTLDLSTNRITGHIPKSICELHGLFVLNLADNLLEGEFPPCFPSLYLSMLLVGNNMLSGMFPPFLRGTNVDILDLTSNKFFGGLPMWIGEISSIIILRLGNNSFSGNIPTTITNLTILLHLDLAGNCFSGVLPLHLSNLTCMKGGCPVTNYGLDVNMSVNTKRLRLYYIKAASLKMVTIDLSSNYLTGGIPEEITSFDGIKNLNLSRNQFSGRIPGNIGAMRSLESLDLSENNLSGEIPSSLSKITSLSYLDLSSNHLTGRIPSGGQLDTLYAENPSMYNGNNGLCGYPLWRNCSDNSSASKHGVEQRSERDSESMFLYFGLGSGFMVGLWVVFCTILFKKAWRIAYFRLFDEVYDKVYVFVVVTWATLSQKSGRR